MRRYLILIIAMLSGIQHLIAQNSIHGTVKDETDRPVGYATVTLHGDSAQSSPMKGYAITDSKGRFDIQADVRQGDWLIARSIGYADEKVKVELLENEIGMVMKEDERSLSEVLVKGNYAGVKFAGDTIKFDTNHFKNGTEDNLGDVLRKLPGMKVSDEGKVSYAGKSIDRLLVDGKDLFSSGEDGIVVNNMDAGLMKSAELLTKYRENNIADEFRNRDLLALNIKTEGDWKITGNTNAHGGIKNKYNEKSTAIYVSDHLSLTGIVSANNIGSPIFSIQDYIENATGADSRLGNSNTSFTLSDEESNILFPPENVYKNSTGLVSLTANYKPTEKFRMKSNVLFNNSSLHAKSTSEDFYLSDNSTNARLSNNESRNNIFTVSLWEEWKAGKRFEINSSTILSAVKADKDRSETNTGKGQINMFHNENFNKINLTQKIETNHSVGKGVLFFNVLFLFSNQKADNHLLTDSILLPISYKYDPQSLYAYSFLTNKTNREVSVAPEIGYTFNFAKDYNLNFSISYLYKHHEQIYSKELENEREERYDKQEYTANTFLKKSNGMMRFRIGSAWSWRDYSSNISELNTSAWSIAPSASLELTFKQTHGLDLSFSYKLEDIEPQHLSRMLMPDQYSSMTAASSVNKPYYKQMNGSFMYHVYNLYSKSFLTMVGGISKKYDVVRPHITQQGIVSISAYDNDGKSTMFYAHANWQKGLNFIPVEATVSLSYNYFVSTTIVNEVDDKMKTNSIGCSLKLRSSFNSAFNGELSGGYKHNTNQFSYSKVSNEMNNFDVMSKLHYVNKSWRGYVYFQYKSADNPVFSNEIYDLGFSMEYRVKKLGIRLSGQNLLNLNKLEWVNISTTPYCISTSTYNKIPGNLLLGLTYRF